MPEVDQQTGADSACDKADTCVFDDHCPFRSRCSRFEGRSVFEGISSATLLKPGDRVLLTVSARWTMHHSHEADRYLSERWPDVEFVFLTEIDSVLVKPAEGSGRA